MEIYNSLTFQKEKFEPIHPDQVLMYVCGPTVYDSPHLGHAKSAVAFDLIRRYLEYKGYEVKLVKNYTDIDDKIIQRANEKGMDYQELSEKYIQEYEEIMDRLNIKRDYKNPRATEVIDFMIKIIKKLIEQRYAYETGGSVYFSIKTFPKYKTIFQNVTEEDLEEEEQEDGYEFDAPPGMKKNPKDFALWKKKKPNEPSWTSPWSEGRPGWHMECSAMALKFLGDTIDIHGGGQDLKSPHHRNEITQAEAYTGQQFANYFVHNGFVNVDDEKMSKSLGNFFLVSQVLEEYDPMVIRWFLISSHYRKSINYSSDTINQAEKNYKKLLHTIRFIYNIDEFSEHNKENKTLISKLQTSKEKIIEVMDDDFNTPEAIAELLTLFRELNANLFENDVQISKEFKDKFCAFIEYIEQILGIFPNLEEKILGITPKTREETEIIKNLFDLIVEIRAELRSRKMYELSDEIRNKLREMGFNIEDR